MRTYTNSLLRLLSVLALLSVAPPASAYYDPGMQRWINRDPINERGVELFPHPRSARISYYGHDFAFLRNAPIASIDPLGLIKFGKKCTDRDKEKLKKEAADRCKKAKDGDCYRCLDKGNGQKMQDACDSKDGSGPTVECEDESNKRCVDKPSGSPLGWTDNGVMHICMNQDPGCGFIHELGHAVGGVGPDGPFTPNPDNRAYAVAKCAGCPIPEGRDTTPGY